MTRLSPRQLRRQAFLAKWTKVDWSKQNCELAAGLGLSGERIRQIRQQLGAPKSTHHRRMRKTTRALQWARDNLDKLKGLSGSELRRKYGLSRQWRAGPLYQVLKPLLRDGRRIRKHRWDLMNFRLPGRDLERIWRLPRKMATMYRLRNRLPPPAWRYRPGNRHIKLSGLRQLQAYQRSARAEEQNAARYFAQAPGCGAGGKTA